MALARSPCAPSLSRVASLAAALLPLLLLLQCARLAGAQNPRRRAPPKIDHQAHSVPGGPYTGIDIGQSRDAVVFLDGSRSHSHYFNARTGATGKIVKYVWVANGKTFCTTAKCKQRFPRGRTTVRLTVVDQTGDRASAIARVNVVSGSAAGLRLWFYPGNGNVKEPKLAGSPSLSRTFGLLRMATKAAFPKRVQGSKFSMRVLGDIRFPKAGLYRFRLRCEAGSCLMWLNTRKVISGGFQTLPSKTVVVSKGAQRLHILFRRKFSGPRMPKVALYWRGPGSKAFSLVPRSVLSHRPSILLPVVHYISPAKGRIGDEIRLFGSSFTNLKSVRIGNTKCDAPSVLNPSVIKCFLPGGRGMQTVSVTTAAGTSNKWNIEIVAPKAKPTKPPPTPDPRKPDPRKPDPRKPPPGGCKSGRVSEPQTNGNIGYFQSVGFRKTVLTKGGKKWDRDALTSIVLGPDMKYYLGSMEGVVYVIRTNYENAITSECRSSNVGNDRSILGLAFNPALGNKIALYATVCTLYWASNNKFPFEKGWHNGEVILMEKTSSNSCLQKTKTVISGLPVSNYDHGVNHLQFDQSGNLLITVGSSTNFGVPGSELGGIADSPLSGTMLIASVMKKGFNGNVKYSQYNNPETANKVSGDVSTYVVGLRNSFGFCIHSNGNIYATTNGGNQNFGPRSTGCNSEGSPQDEPDALVQIKRGKWYGSANRNRGRFDSKQCVHRSPTDSGGGFEKPMVTLQPSTNGLLEYTANTFGAQVRGNLIATKFASEGDGEVFRIQLDGGRVRSTSELHDDSGVAVALTPTGGLFMPRVYQEEVVVLLPEERNPGNGLMVITTVFPFRGPRKGGNRITITGWNLSPPLTVTVGGRECRNVGNFRDGRSLTCTVPCGSGKVSVIARKGKKASRSYGFEYMYMNI